MTGKQSFQHDLRNMQIHGFDGRNPERLNVCASVPGRERYAWYHIPVIHDKAVKLAAEKGITVTELADEWNERINKAENMSELGAFRFTVTLTAEEFEALLGKG